MAKSISIKDAERRCGGCAPKVVIWFKLRKSYPNKEQKGPPRKRQPHCEFANRKFQIREFKYLLLVRCRSRGGSAAALHLLRIILDKGLQVAVAEASVKIVVLHLGVRLVEIPVVHIEPIDGAHNS